MRKLVLTALLPGLMMLAAPARATMLTATFHGHVVSGAIDQASFGLAAGTSVVGLAYTATYTIDDSLGSLNTDTADSTGLVGGYQLAPLGSFASPADGSLELNGISQAFPGLYLGDVSKYYLPASPFSNYSAGVETLADTALGQVDLQLSQSIVVDSAMFASTDFRDTGSYTAIIEDPSLDPAYAYVFAQSYAIATLILDPDGDPVPGSPDLYALGLQPDSLTITEAGSAVPEAPIWSMLLIGFAAIGSAIRGGNLAHANRRFARGI
ncbi:hypothetical protein [Sphingomonas nostoxanthinifaciens]|uniref:hypothetical protein n=1 Tax=Sphingomonas nostoxanthinifaciens TaxID=2872652 RepID=UPI001CC1D6C2|nr:hypothetical protein [Sphingomonas nostoxanthinifaciens]UAK25412.1 hypothetical protein K8P63_04325 [Sphingomonas nostoxanthinifaciens]